MSAARVYLMVDTGNGPRVQRGSLASFVCPTGFVALGLRWWLVEAESADAARDCIAAYVESDDRYYNGRIVAAGGAR